MKRSLSLFLVVVVLMSLATMAFAPMAQEGDPVLTEAQLVIVGLIASALTWGLNVAMSKGWQVKREHVAIGLYVISFFAAIGFTPLTFPAFPPFSDAPTFIGAVFTFIGALLALASPIAGMAYLIYNLLLKRVLDKVFPAARG